MKFFLVGYYGYDNTGDDICLLKTKEILLSQFPNSKFAILGSKHKYINRNNILKVFIEIVKSQKVVFGGGGLCQNVTSSRSLYYYFILILCSFLLNKPIYALSQGIGPIKGSINKWVLKYIFKCFTSISLRDKSYIKYLSKPSHTITSDLAFYKQYQHKTNDQSDKIGLNISTSSYIEEAKKIINYLDSMHVKYSFLSLCPTKDSKVLQLIDTKNIAINTINSKNFYKKNDTTFKYIIAMRYHCCVWAALQGIPFIALAYDEKVELISKQLNQPIIKMYDKSFSIKTFSKIYKEFIQNYEQFKKNINIKCDSLINLSLKNEKVIL